MIDVFVEALDLHGMGFVRVIAKTGRPAYHPAVLLKLYIYGYLVAYNLTRVMNIVGKPSLIAAIRAA